MSVLLIGILNLLINESRNFIISFALLNILYFLIKTYLFNFLSSRLSFAKNTNHLKWDSAVPAGFPWDQITDAHREIVIYCHFFFPLSSFQYKMTTKLLRKLSWRYMFFLIDMKGQYQLLASRQEICNTQNFCSSSTTTSKVDNSLYPIL